MSDDMTIENAARILEALDTDRTVPLTEEQLGAVMTIARAYKRGDVGRASAVALLGRAGLHVPSGPF